MLADTPLARAGYDARIKKSLDLPRDLMPGRVTMQLRSDRFRVLTEAGECAALVHLDRSVSGPRSAAVGDWVGVERDGDTVIIRRIMQRNTALTRKTAGRETVEQVLAANIHWVFVLSAPTGELNPRRIERFLTAIFDSGARPAIMLTKADLVSDPFSHVRQLNQICPGVPVHAVSVPAGRGLEALPRYFMGNRTAALIGSSGVGKSTLLNHLAGGPIERVQTTRSDDKGKHTTTYRRLVVLPAGGAVVDTPGMRELQLWDGSPEEAFADVMALAQRCRFADCRHSGEPGCAVSAAVAAGEIAQSRIDSYNKLQLELRHIQAKKDKRARTERRQGRRRASPSRRCPP